MTIKQIAYFIAVLCLSTTASCDNNNQHTNQVNALSNCPTDAGIDYDESKLKIKSVENLDIYNGVKMFRFGLPLDIYKTCIECNSLSVYKSCTYKNTLAFLGKSWSIVLFSENDSLIAVKLKSANIYETDAHEVYEKLYSIFGSPNKEVFKK